jgi:hypothetical protein
MKKSRNWIIALVLTATAGFFALQNGHSPELPATVLETATPAITSASEGCAYTWAYHDAPELTEKFSAHISSFNPKAESHVSLFGEDCTYADGHADFLVKETDFYVRLPVEDLTNEEALGNWMAQVMELTLKIPREEIQGSDGFVEFWFEKDKSGQIILRVPIQIYKDEARGKNGAELYRIFSNPIPF